MYNIITCIRYIDHQVSSQMIYIVYVKNRWYAMDMYGQMWSSLLPSQTAPHSYDPTFTCTRRQECWSCWQLCGGLAIFGIHCLFPRVNLEQYLPIFIYNYIYILIYQYFTSTWFPLKGWGPWKISSSIACTSDGSAISSRSDLVAQCHELRESQTRNQRC